MLLTSTRDIELVCERVILIDEGRIWWTSPPRSCGGAFSVARSHDPVGWPSVAPDLPGAAR